MLPPAKQEAGGGGGGGERAKIEAPQGRLPKVSMEQQITPPAIVVRNEHPKLTAEPTVVAPRQSSSLLKCRTWVILRPRLGPPLLSRMEQDQVEESGPAPVAESERALDPGLVKATVAVSVEVCSE